MRNFKAKSIFFPLRVPTRLFYLPQILALEGIKKASCIYLHFQQVRRNKTPPVIKYTLNPFWKYTSWDFPEGFFALVNKYMCSAGD